MIPLIEPVLYIDPQQERRIRFCENCGGICYWPSFTCSRCEEGEP